MELDEAIYYFTKKKIVDEQISFQTYMEGVRIQTYYTVNVQLASKDRYNSPQAFMPFAWDKGAKKVSVKTTPFTDEEAEYYEAKMRKPSTVIGKDLIEVFKTNSNLKR